jgi:hypothetical protein
MDDETFPAFDLDTEDMCFKLRTHPKSYPKMWFDKMNGNGNVHRTNDWKSKALFALKAVEIGDSRMRVCYAHAGASTGRDDVAQVNKPPRQIEDSMHHNTQTLTFHEGKSTKCNVTGAHRDILEGSVAVNTNGNHFEKLFILWIVQEITDWHDKEQRDRNVIICVLDRQHIQQEGGGDVQIQFSLRVGPSGELSPGVRRYDRFMSFVRYGDLDRDLWMKFFPEKY